MKPSIPIVKSFGLFSLLLSFAVVFSGCSSKPSDGDGEQAIQNQINQDSQGRIKLVEFHKTNGQLAEVNAVKVYNLEYEAVIEFTGNCKWITGLGGIEMGFRTSQLPNRSLGALAQFAADDAMPGTIVKQGQQVKISGVIRFEKKENGWSVDEIDIKSANPVTGSATSSGTASPTLADAAAAQQAATRKSMQAATEATSQSQKQQTSDSEELTVVKVLKQINASKNQWALETGKVRGVIPTAEDLKQYFSHGEFPVHPPGGDYIINAVGQPPESTKYGTFDKLEVKYHDLLNPIPIRNYSNMTANELENSVFNDLRRIDYAKNMWALTNGKTTGSLPTWDDLKPFLDKFPSMGVGIPEHPPGGQYIINPVGQPPESSTYGKLP